MALPEISKHRSVGMSVRDKMVSVPFQRLVEHMLYEYAGESTIFGIHADQFFFKQHDSRLDYYGNRYDTPVGPAAGPHTQLTQNIISAYLAGGRFIELKTVQILDNLEIEKPCIDARDEGYNVEWSTEFTLQGAYDEYVKAWILVHLLKVLFFTDKHTHGDMDCIFNMSVGYDLKGIQTEPMQRYIDSMINAADDPLFNGYITELLELLDDGGLFRETGFGGRIEALREMAATISPAISPTVTLSTMHGCPPDEIEAICRYMLAEKGITTYVKLNPTLLGFDRVRSMLNSMGYGYVTLSEKTFSHDLQYLDAVAMLDRLQKLADELGLGFGVKLTNTLGTVNDQGILPGDEMYMSGRSLYPVSIALAAELSRDFSGRLPISYSGGVNCENVAEIFSSGIRPVTVATDLLKPGGYARLAEMAAVCEETDAWHMNRVNSEHLQSIAETALCNHNYEKEKRGFLPVAVQSGLPMTDCYIAPCVSACPIHQDIPEYIQLVGEKRYAEALELIYDKNPLPGITGYICDHQCMYNCTRLDYEGAVEIREMKRIAVEHGFEEYLSAIWDEPEHADTRAAVIGAGPAGLSAAYFLARAGFSVTVYERESSAGGVVTHVIPDFRLPREVVEADIAFIERQGVDFRFGVSIEEVSVEALRKEGCSYIIFAIGAEQDKLITVAGEGGRVQPALEFLGTFRRDRNSLSPGRNVVITGGGNTAMDSARAALTLPDVESVTVLYRRTKHEMPADLEEFDNAVAEGAEFAFLAVPEKFTDDGMLLCRKMQLGELDASGRRSPVPTDETVTIPCDTLITAIGERVDTGILKACGLPLNERGWTDVSPETLETAVDGVYIIGDAQSGPSTIVRCMASARLAVEAILDSILGPEETGDDEHEHEHEGAIEDGEGHEVALEEMEAAENAFFAEIRSKKSHWLPAAARDLSDVQFAAVEQSRCLECSYICNKCVDVCPNRANITVDVRDSGLFAHPFQIVHIDDYCNECGNCATFCPWEGKPYKDKFTIFSNEQNMKDSENPGCCFAADAVLCRTAGEIRRYPIVSGAVTGMENLQVQELVQQILDRYAYYL